jgi:hypothetical protein
MSMTSSYSTHETTRAVLVKAIEVGGRGVGLIGPLKGDLFAFYSPRAPAAFDVYGLDGFKRFSVTTTANSVIEDQPRMTTSYIDKIQFVDKETIKSSDPFRSGRVECAKLSLLLRLKYVGQLTSYAMVDKKTLLIVSSPMIIPSVQMAHLPTVKLRNRIYGTDYRVVSIVNLSTKTIRPLLKSPKRPYSGEAMSQRAADNSADVVYFPHKKSFAWHLEGTVYICRLFRR